MRFGMTVAALLLGAGAAFAQAPGVQRPADLLGARGGASALPDARGPSFGDPVLDPELRRRLERAEEEQRGFDRMDSADSGPRTDGLPPVERQRIIIERLLER